MFYGRVVGSVDRPSGAEEPGSGERAGASGADRPTPVARELPDPDERGRVYEAMRAHVEAPPAEGTRRADAVNQGGYRDQVPRFGGIWADHEKRWPAERQPAPDRSADPPRADRCNGGSDPRPERRAATSEAIGRIREAERGLSADTQAVERENDYDGQLAGFKHRLKGEDRLNEKIAEKLGAEPRLTVPEALREVADAIRYTYCFQPTNYAKGYYNIKERLESRGYEMYYSKNWWTDFEYKGINTRWVTADGQRFEVQFHTPESFHAKHHVTHAAYERIRDPATSRAERRELHAFQREVCSHIKVPDAAMDIPSYRKEGF
jgi:hypothetical protein